MSLRVFISYSRNDKDKKVAQDIVELLGAMGVDPFIDEDIVPGEDYVKKIVTELPRCSALVVVISPASLDSTWVHCEIGQALSLGLPVVSYLTDTYLEHK